MTNFANNRFYTTLQKKRKRMSWNRDIWLQ